MTPAKIFVVAAGQAKKGLEHAIRELVPDVQFTEIESEADLVVCIDEEEFWLRRNNFEDVFFVIYNHLGEVDEIIRELPYNCHFIEDDDRMIKICRKSHEELDLMLTELQKER